MLIPIPLGRRAIEVASCPFAMKTSAALSGATLASNAFPAAWGGLSPGGSPETSLRSAARPPWAMPPSILSVAGWKAVCSARVAPHLRAAPAVQLRPSALAAAPGVQWLLVLPHWQTVRDDVDDKAFWSPSPRSARRRNSEWHARRKPEHDASDPSKCSSLRRCNSVGGKQSASAGLHRRA